jgi:hypothetical protein
VMNAYSAANMLHPPCASATIHLLPVNYRNANKWTKRKGAAAPAKEREEINENRRGRNCQEAVKDPALLGCVQKQLPRLAATRSGARAARAPLRVAANRNYFWTPP